MTGKDSELRYDSTVLPRILSLHPALDLNPLWCTRAESILCHDPEFFQRTRAARLWRLVSAARRGRYDVCVFAPEIDRWFLFLALLLLRKVSVASVVAESYLAFGVPGWRSRRRIRSYRALLSRACLVTVQSRFEVPLYASHFGDRVRCRFVPWYSAEPVTPLSPRAWRRRWRDGYVLCAGHYRDLATFVEAARDLPRRVVVACGREDADALGQLPQGVEVLVGLPVDRYRALFDDAAVVVLPFMRSCMLRSLGHIAYMTAARRAVPVITTETPHLSDYVLPGREVLTVAPEDPAALRETLTAVLKHPALAWRVARAARQGSRRRFTPAEHVTTLLREVDDAWRARSRDRHTVHQR
jgi:glycosyltransferase involved in cell wall biosynthesis